MLYSMTWLLAGIVPPIIFALVNHADKYLLSKTKYHSSVNVLMVYSTMFSFVVIPFLFYFARAELFLNTLQVCIQIVGGILLALSVYFYLIALNKDEASVVVSFFLLVPVFGFIFSYFVLGEILTQNQVIACLLIIAGATVLSLEFEEERKFKVKHGVLFFMLLCTSFQAAQETLFKLVTIENSLTVSLFWLHAGIAICGLVLILVKKELFSTFLHSVRLNGAKIFGVNFFSEAATAIAYMIREYAALLVPITIIMALNGYQPVFVFILGTLLTILSPKLVHEKIKPLHLVHKGIAIAVILSGTILVAQTM